MNTHRTRTPVRLGEILRNARITAGLTQDQLAANLGVTQPTVSQWERGVTTPTLDNARQIAAELRLEAAELIGAES
jgi:transcriptional regulator with XRE-family HTH domain